MSQTQTQIQTQTQLHFPLGWIPALFVGALMWAVLFVVAHAVYALFA